jgi:membrane-bound ClpP family serine protease
MPKLNAATIPLVFGVFCILDGLAQLRYHPPVASVTVLFCAGVACIVLGFFQLKKRTS